jgi:predicted anti-sigma-YlaC factor YlaD
MRCREARFWLAAQREGDLAQSDTSRLQEHLEHCSACRAYEQSPHCHNRAPLPPTPCSLSSSSSISTERILQAVERQKHISRQLEDIRAQQRSRIARLRGIGTFLAAITFFSLGCVPLLLLALTIVRPDLLEQTLSYLGDGVGVLIILGQYFQRGLKLLISDNWLLLSAAFVMVVMMGMWLRLMRHPQEA